MIGQIVGSPTVAAGWIYHLFNGAVIATIFGWVLGTRVRGYRSGLGWGGAYGLAWWILGCLIVMPVMLGMPAFAPLMMPRCRWVAAGSLMVHLIDGLILGGLYVALRHRTPVAVA